MRLRGTKWFAWASIAGFLALKGTFGGFLEGDWVEGWFTVGAGAVVVTIGFLSRGRKNSRHAELPTPPKQVIPLLPLRETPRYGRTLVDPVSCPVPFVGREEETARLGAWLADPAGGPLMVVAGPPGVGKSRLMIEFARTREHEWRCGRLAPGPSRGLIAQLASAGQPALILVDEADLRGDVPLLLAELHGHRGRTPIRVIAEARRPGGLEARFGPVIRVGDPDDLDLCFAMALDAFEGEEREDMPTPPGPVFDVVDRARLAARPHAIPLLARERQKWTGGRFREAAVVVDLLVGERPEILQRISDMDGRPAARGGLMPGRVMGEPLRPVLVAARLLSEVAAARPGIIDVITRGLSWQDARRALWWLGIVAEESPEAAAAFLRLAASHDLLVPRAVCCLVGDAMAEPLAKLVAARQWDLAELDAVDSPDLPEAVRSALAAARETAT
ncbi:ATP-binding protein [Herbidospora galbida]|uniref:ATP-binding protein n=1 Tax=Herbidospora galbida TaxID=2575442 RepID=A0A4U3MI56_9ACTN|nr:ATP-binding protein [Herbidospora galbida]TKK88192.1 ATP-binding protein [Herbidospora galbida]